MSKNQRNIIFAVLSILLATIMWLYVTIITDPESSTEIRAIPIQYIGEEALAARDLSVIENRTGTVKVTVYGRRTDYSAVNSGNIYAEVDLSTITMPGLFNRYYDIILPENLRNSLTITDRNPAYVELLIDREDSRVFEVQLVSNINAAEGFIVGQGTVDPHEIRVRGPSTILDSISHAEVTLDVEDADKTIDSMASFKLIDNDGNEVNGYITPEVPEVRLYVPVLKEKVVALNVDFRDGGGLTAAENINYTIKPESIRISGDASVVNDINTIDLGVIDLSKLDKSGSKEFNIVLPNNTTGVSGEQTAVVEVEIVGARMTTITTENISIINADPPEGYTVLPSLKEVTVYVRGPNNMVGLVTPFNVRVVVDLEGEPLTPRKHALYPATIYIDGVSKVGAVGNYSVSVEVVPIEE